jgi:hypothetical protein
MFHIWTGLSCGGRNGNMYHIWTGFSCGGRLLACETSNGVVHIGCHVQSSSK